VIDVARDLTCDAYLRQLDERFLQIGHGRPIRLKALASIHQGGYAKVRRAGSYMWLFEHASWLIQFPCGRLHRLAACTILAVMPI
jgi:hypothetical protein